MRASVVTIFTALLATVSFGQTLPPNAVIRASYDLVAPNGLVHVDDYDVSGHRQTHVRVASSSGTADLTFDGHSIAFDDGYSLAITRLASTPNAFIARYAATGPDGGNATAIIGMNLVTSEVTHAGVNDVAQLLRHSHSARIAGEVMAALGQSHAPLPLGRNAAAQKHATKPLRPAPADCATSGITLVISSAGVFTCVEPTLACIAGISGVVSSTYSLVKEGCNTEYDNTIGWG